MLKTKIISGISLILLSTVCLAEGNSADSALTVKQNELSAFQEFDDQYYIGYGLGIGNATNSYKQNASYSTTNVGFGVEKLFDMGVWASFNGMLMTNYYNHSSNPNAKSEPVGLDPSVANLDLKVGYAFPLIQNDLLITPYGLIGRNTNITSTSLKDNMDPDSGTSTITVNSTHDYFLSTGIGGRLEYRLDRVFDFYFDQNAIYNIDMSQPNSQYAPLSNVSFTSTLGAKFNIWRELQLGAQTYYTFSELTNSLTASQQYALIPNAFFGGMVTVGLTY